MMGDPKGFAAWGLGKPRIPRAPCLSLACGDTALQCPPQHIQNELHAEEGKVSPAVSPTGGEKQTW